ncbi:MAG: TonB-dependent receptor, partial [Saprospiraceae bacterium]
KAGIVQEVEFNLIPIAQIGEVVVLGSRSATPRTMMNTPVPVDVFTSVHLLQTGQASLTQMLNYVAPSFNASREILNEPSTLRGLDPQHVLILMNGIRYHNMSWLFAGGLKGQLGRGSVGNDLNSIPFSAIEKIEILRDGASALYGSDAIAGVINVQLKKSTGKTSIQLNTGQFYKGDGQKFSFGINGGFSINKKGFIHISATHRYQAPTYRGGEYSGTVYKNYPTNFTREDSVAIKAQDDSIVLERGFNRKTAVDNVGNSKLFSTGLLINAGYPINDHTELFLTATGNGRKIVRGAAYRFPKNTNQVNLALFPNGFQAKSMSNTFDASFIAGIKGETKNNWHWDFSSSFGSNSLINNVSNTNNASQSYLGKNAPTSFYTGKDIYRQIIQNINFAKSYDKRPGPLKTTSLGGGAEWRVENYHTMEGDEASWKSYDLTGLKQGGSQGNAGHIPTNLVNKYRTVLGTYIEVESRPMNHLLMDIAGRYEYYSDFGNNLAVKLATRYIFSEKLTLRASLNNGFRAPSLQQRYINSVQTGFINSGGVIIPGLRGTFPNDHAVIKALGIPSLTAEKSLNMNSGFTSSLSNQIHLSVDAYWIQIKNRIILSGTLDRNIPAVRKIIDNIPGLRIDQVQFFANAINTRTKGIDLILDGTWNIHKSSLGISLAANFNSTRLFGEINTKSNLPTDSLNINTIFNIEEKVRMEKGQPADKMILTISYKKSKSKWVINNTRFGQTAIAPVSRDRTKVLYETFSSKILTDVHWDYSFKTWCTFTLGANNIFDVYPDRLMNYETTLQGNYIYSPEASPFAFNGGYYYVGLSLNL